MIDIPKEEYKHILQQDVFHTYEQGLIQDGKALEGTTNGDIIKAIFPNIEITYHNNNIELYNKDSISAEVLYNWWNAPYRAESEE